MSDAVRPAEDGESRYIHEGGVYSPTSQIAIDHLLKSILKRNPHVDATAIGNALKFSVAAHSDQVRKSGVPYAEHPVEVAKLLAEYKMDTPTLIAGLLHDVVEDTSTDLEQVQAMFGAEVAFMVDAVTKINTLQAGNKEQQTAQTYRKMLISMAEDPRVLMIKIADRLHNMRTLGWMPTIAKRRTIAQETMDVYAPLAHRFGLSKVKAEMEDLAFQTLYPEEYSRVMGELLEYRTDRELYIDKMTDMAVIALAGHGLEVQVQGRPKHIYSIWQKQKRRSCSIDQIYDIFALRVIVKKKTDCYAALGAIHSSWTPLQARFKDYIAVPKPNLYQSLHTTVVGPDERMVEFQIRTKEMDLVAERGFAAHWSYKEEENNPQSGGIGWLRQLVHVQEEISDSKEFLEFLKIDLAPQELVAFTPAGDSISLPHGATVLDFAYAIHTELGNQCIGARIDGVYVRPERKILYGSTVSVLHSPHQSPSREWLSWVKTHKATSSIRKWFRDEMCKKMGDLGKAILARECKFFGTSARPRESDLLKLFPAMENIDQLYEAIGSGRVSIKELHRALEIPEDAALSGDVELPVELGSNPLLQFSNCCSAIPGDQIVGLLVPGEGVAIHRTDCIEARQQLQSGKYERIPVKWSDSKRKKSTVSLDIIGTEREGMLEETLHIFTRHGARILRVNAATIGDQVRMRFQLKVDGLAQVEAIRQRLLEIPEIQKVERRIKKGRLKGEETDEQETTPSSP